MSVPVRLTESALADLLAINDHFLLEVRDKMAGKIIDNLETAVNSLADLNERGTVPRELLTLGIRQYCQLIVKPYRIIYQSLHDQVVVHAFGWAPRYTDVVNSALDRQSLVEQIRKLRMIRPCSHP